MTHRLFVGIRPPAAIRDALIDLMEGVEAARWQDEDQLHPTNWRSDYAPRKGKGLR